MSGSIDFYFDFSSPYGYLASHRIDAVAEKHGRVVKWHPVLLGAIFKSTGALPLATSPVKFAYMKRDCARSARMHDVPFALPDVFPFSGVAASRAYYIVADTDPIAAHAFAKLIYDAAFAQGQDVASKPVVGHALHEAGADAPAVLEAMGEDRWKQYLFTANEQALARGAFGSPFFFVDDEPFFGNDRVPEVDAWLTSGGW